jgi:hypothetical protein
MFWLKFVILQKPINKVTDKKYSEYKTNISMVAQ